MSLLRGLAERALGTARPVRSQRASPLRALQRDASVAALPASETTSMTQRPAETPSLGVQPQPHSTATPAREAPTSIYMETHIPPLVVLHRTEPDAAPSKLATPATAHRAGAAPQAPQSPHTPRMASGDPLPPAHDHASMPDPEPLVNRRAPPPRESPPPRSANAITPHRERQPSRTAAMPSPTEVHVSIGRVELTALAPAPTPRAARPRDSSARSLSDYLRGPRGTS